jgi:cysteine synthase
MIGVSVPTLLERIGQTPLVRLVHLAAGLPVPVYAKCEHLQPGGSVKDRIALAIVNDAERRGLLRPGATLIEATARNTGIGLALVAPARGYHLACELPEKMAWGDPDAPFALDGTPKDRHLRCIRNGHRLAGRK